MKKQKTDNIYEIEKADAADTAANELFTVCDFVRYAVTRFNDAEISYGHGTTNALDEAAFMVLESLRLPHDALEPYWNARLTSPERTRLAALIHERTATRKPASYLLKKAYIQGFPFYVDERVIVPRSFIGELICTPDGLPFIGDPEEIGSVLDLCTGSGCLAILAAHIFPNAKVDAVDLSSDALDVARQNIADYGLEDRIALYNGDLFAPIAGKKYDLIITNPPYVDAEAMANLPPEFRHEPEMALGSGIDGLDITRRILKDARQHLNADGGLICEIGRGREVLECDFPSLDLLWLDTEDSRGEVFWIAAEDL